MNKHLHYFLFVIVTIVVLSFNITTAGKASSYNTNTSRDYFYYVGPIPGNYTYTQNCDKGSGYPLCYNEGQRRTIPSLPRHQARWLGQDESSFIFIGDERHRA
jgi:hypothetical protein